MYHLPLKCAFALCAGAGFSGVELVMGPEVWLRGGRAVAELARAHHLAIHSVHQALWSPSPWDRAESRMIDAVRFATAIGCACVVIHGPEAFRWAEPTAQRWLRAMEGCQSLAQGSATRLTLENGGRYSRLDGHKVLGQVEVLQSFARRHDLDLTLDTCHAGAGMLHYYQVMRGRLSNVHFSDLRPSDDEAHTHLRRTLFVHHQMPGEGFLPLPSLVGALHSDGYAGPITMEISPVALQPWSGAVLRQRLAQAAGYLRSLSPDPSSDKPLAPMSRR